MFQQLLNLLPQEFATVTWIVAGVGLLAGIGFWLTGARFSCAMLTLAAVALGTVVGMKLPKWCDWSIDPMGPAVGIALVLGLSAFVLHRVWVGASLGLIVAAWATLALWGPLAHDASWQWPAFHNSQSLPKYLCAVWDSLPGGLHKWLPYIAGASLIGAMLIALIRPKLATLTLWSAIGTSLMIAMSFLLLSHLDSPFLARLPAQTGPQIAILGGAIILGALFQWRFTSKFWTKSKQPAEQPQETPH